MTTKTPEALRLAQQFAERWKECQRGSKYGVIGENYGMMARAYLALSAQAETLREENEKHKQIATDALAVAQFQEQRAERAEAADAIEALRARHERACAEVLRLAELLTACNPKWGAPMHLNEGKP
jgi:hypothetical protein